MTAKLKEAREKAGYSIEHVASVLKIRKQYVVDLEEGNLVGILGKTYVDGYQKIYHEFLGLEWKDENDHKLPAPPAESENVRIIKQKLIILTSLLMLVLVVGVYSL